ncbi:MAG: efflux RND transporter periplasmic adaptor subunit [Gammaproteobacteria bacterium]|nr:efflux RND transporter periplasmic adaptor subunit [Gammaproteobacteria bacterium]
MPLKRFALISLALLVPGLGLTACDRGPAEERAAPVRGLKAMTVSESAAVQLRRYPSVIEPADQSPLSFEVGGRIEKLPMEVGMDVEVGDLLAALDARSYELQRDQADARLDEANANLETARSQYRRNQELAEQGLVATKTLEDSKSALDAAVAQASQAERQFNLAERDYGKTRLLAPFTGRIASVTVDPFEQVSPGQRVGAIYSEQGFEVSFSVPASVLEQLEVGTAVRIDVPDLKLEAVQGRISELGNRASEVSSFPVTVTVVEPPPRLRAGMAAEVELDVAALRGAGYLVPLSAFEFDANEDLQMAGRLWVYDAESSTVSSRMVQISGVRGNELIVSDGLEIGDVVAVAGVSYLREGQRVNLLPMQE